MKIDPNKIFKNPPTNNQSNYDIIIYTDGGCRNHGNTKNHHVKATDPSAWAYLIQITKPNIATLTATAGKFGATNNEMELTALIQALKTVKHYQLNNQHIEIIADSHYVLDPITKHWLTNWQARNWKTSTNQPVANQKLWKNLVILLTDFPHISFNWTKGHAKNSGNNQVDNMLNNTMDLMETK